MYSKSTSFRPKLSQTSATLGLSSLASLTSLLFRFDFSFGAEEVDDDGEGEGGHGEDVALRLGRGMVKLLNVSPIQTFVEKTHNRKTQFLKTCLEQGFHRDHIL